MDRLSEIAELAAATSSKNMAVQTLMIGILEHLGRTDPDAIQLIAARAHALISDGDSEPLRVARDQIDMISEAAQAFSAGAR